MDVKIKATNNSFYLFLYWIINTLGGFFFWLIAGKFLDQSEYGIALTAVSFGFFTISIITVGIPAALSKLIPEYKSKKQFKKIKSVITTSFVFLLFSNIITLSIFLLIKSYLVEVLKTTETVFYFILGYIFFGSFSVTLFTIKYAFQEMKRYTIIGFLSIIVKIFTSFTILSLGMKYFGPILGVILSSIITIILAFPSKQINFRLTFKEKDILYYSIIGFVGAIVFSLISNFVYTIITIVKDTSTTGVFGIAMLISSIVVAIPNILNNSIYPIISEIFGKNKKTTSNLISHTIRYSLLLSIPLILIISFNSRFIILSFSSDKFISASEIIPILSLASLILGIAGIFSNSLFAMRMTNQYTKSLLIAGATFLMITPIMTYVYSGIGASISYLITSLTLLVLSYLYLKNKIKIKIDLIDIFKIIFSSFHFFIILMLNPFGIIEFVFINLLCVLFYIYFLYKMNFFTKTDKEIIKFVIDKLRISKLIKIDFV
ncbi:MAG: polysaccharide biosynthesis C-terminal domain-containing protein [candidate division WOR-3 bacterium]